MSSMEDAWEYLGCFWLPDQVGKKIPGKIKYSPSSGVTLELLGTLVEPFSPDEGKSFFMGQVNNWDIIHGEIQAKRDKLVTLFHNCSLKMTSYLGAAALKGAHVLDCKLAIRSSKLWFDKEDLFESSQISFTHFNSWLWSSVFEVKEIFDEESQTLKECSVIYRTPKPFCILDSDYGKAHIHTGIEGSRNQHFLSMKQKSWVKFCHPQKANLEDILTSQYRACIFFSTLMNSPVTVESIKLISQDCKDSQNTLYFKRQFHPLEYESELHPNEMGFSYSDISDALPHTYEKFLQLYECNYLKSALGNYCTVIYRSKDYLLEDSFKSIYTAIEGFCRVQCQTEEEKWPDKLSDFYWLLTDSSVSFLSILPSTVLVADFFKRCKGIRDTLSHVQLTKNQEIYPSLNELLALRYILGLLLQLIILKIIGIPVVLQKSYVERVREKNNLVFDFYRDKDSLFSNQPISQSLTR